MGHTLDQWREAIGRRLNDEAGRDVENFDLDLALQSALAEHTRNRPFEKTVEVAGTGSPYLSAPAGWINDWSRVRVVEYPARRNPPSFLNPLSWRVLGSTADVSIRQILLDRTPGASEYVRLTFTAQWPFPDEDDDTVDQLSDLHYEGVVNLAAAHACATLAAEAARNRSAALPTDFADGSSRNPMLIQAERVLRDNYERICPPFVVVA